MRLASVAALFLIMTSGAAAQKAGSQAASGLEVQIADQPDCPLKVSFASPYAPGPEIRIKVQNTNATPVRAYVVLVDDGKSKQIQTTIWLQKTIGSEEVIYENAGIFSRSRAVLSVDYIRFADGTSWGSDAADASKYIDAFMKGRELAISRLKNMLGGALPDDLQELLEKLELASFGDVSENKGPAVVNRHTLDGYRSIVDLLRRSKKRPEERQDLARKLELMENDLS